MNGFIDIVAGLIGSYFGELILGFQGWKVARMTIFPSVIGAVVLVASMLLDYCKKFLIKN